MRGTSPQPFKSIATKGGEIASVAQAFARTAGAQNGFDNAARPLETPKRDAYVRVSDKIV